jgi:hypothetical protein
MGGRRKKKLEEKQKRREQMFCLNEAQCGRTGIQVVVGQAASKTTAQTATAHGLEPSGRGRNIKPGKIPHLIHHLIVN